jgi:hypothetical protein
MTFAGLWNYCDDEGRALDDLDLVKAFVWPKDRDITLEVLDGMLRQLVAAGLILRYEGEYHGKTACFLAVANWSEHQHPEKPKRSKYPPPVGVRRTRRTRDSSPTRPRGVVGRKGEGRGGEGKGEERSTPPPPTPPPSRAREADDNGKRVEFEQDPRVVQLSTGMDRLGASALVGYLRAAHDPERLLLELGSVVNGSHGPGGRAVPPDKLGRALHEMSVAGAKCTSTILRAFVRRALEPEPAGRPPPAVEGDLSNWVTRKERERAAAR